MQAVQTPDAPKAIGPYSQAVAAGPLLFVSGQLGLDPATGELAPSLPSQARRAMENLRAILRAANLDLGHIVKCTVFLADMKQFAEFNVVYQGFFTAPYPAREVVQAAKLPKDALVEISAIASVEE
ncbi:MAG: RidA family protein [Lentisphaerae bacterium]|nr:RidA family protein [Lentisphaerota bacterium]